MSKPFVIVFTGGPRGGKSEAINHLRATLPPKGIEVSVLPEAATWLMEAGFHPRDSYYRDSALWDKTRLHIQTTWEDRAIALSREKGGRQVILVDRGIPDGEPFCPPHLWRQAVDSLKLSPSAIFARYDLAMHLVSSAVDLPAEAYDSKTNPHRYHNFEEARLSDSRLGEIWSRHPNYQRIDNAGGMEGKLARITAILDDRLNPVPSVPTGIIPLPSRGHSNERLR